MNILRTRRARLWAAIAIILGLIAVFPLSLAFSLIGLGDMGVTARSLRGPVWWGGAEDLSLGGVRLGTVNVFLDPFHLLIGQARVELIRVNGRADDLLGALLIGPGVRGLETVTGSVPLGSSLAPLPVNRATFEKFSARFSGGRCVSADGNVRVQVTPLIGGLDLANGLSGQVRCDGEVLLMPLASQSGQEKLELRIRANGSYEATMRIRTTDPALTASLSASDFQAAGGDQMMRIAGTL
jgi:general secretion pathway protein N